MGPISHLGGTETLQRETERLQSHLGEIEIPIGETEKTRVSHIHICPKPKVKLGPTETFYPAPPSSVNIARAINPSLFGLTDRDLGLTEMGL